MSRICALGGVDAIQSKIKGNGGFKTSESVFTMVENGFLMCCQTFEIDGEAVCIDFSGFKGQRTDAIIRLKITRIVCWNPSKQTIGRPDYFHNCLLLLILNPLCEFVYSLIVEGIFTDTIGAKKLSIGCRTIRLKGHFN